jgi:hypothetical protein
VSMPTLDISASSSPEQLFAISHVIVVVDIRKTQGNYAAYAALGFSKHLGGDVDGAIDSYHEALSRKPEDPFTSEMLTRALSEAVTYPPSLAMLSSLPTGEEVGFGGVGSSILKKMGGSSGNGRSVPLCNNDHDMSIFASNASDVDMSFV